MKSLTKFLIFAFIINVIFAFIVIDSRAEIVNYENLTTSNYRLLKISDDINIKYLNEYEYQVFINGTLLNNFKKDDNIFIPDNSSVIIYVPNNINTNFENTYDLGKSLIYIAVMYLFAGIGIILILIILIKKFLWRK